MRLALEAAGGAAGGRARLAMRHRQARAAGARRPSEARDAVTYERANTAFHRTIAAAARNAPAADPVRRDERQQARRWLAAPGRERQLLQAAIGPCRLPRRGRAPPSPRATASARPGSDAPAPQRRPEPHPAPDLHAAPGRSQLGRRHHFSSGEDPIRLAAGRRRSALRSRRDQGAPETPVRDQRVSRCRVAAAPASIMLDAVAEGEDPGRRRIAGSGERGAVDLGMGLSDPAHGAAELRHRARRWRLAPARARCP